MKKLEIKAVRLNIPFLASFKHASSERKKMNSVLVRITRDGVTGFGEGCPREYVTGETIDSALSWISSMKEIIEKECSSFDDLKSFVKENENLIDGNESAWCAVETSLLDLFGKEENKSVEELTGINGKKDFTYTAVIGNGSYETLLNHYDIYSEIGFIDYKMKISGDFEQDSLKIDLYREKVTGFPADKVKLRVDANNLWKDENEALKYIKKLDFPFSAIEEPLESRDTKKSEYIYENLKTPIILDESMCRIKDIDLYSNLGGEYIANLKLSKIGGLLRGIEIVKKLKELNWKIIIGAHVGETSILTRMALAFSGFCGESLIAQEGAFGTLLIKYDVFEPVLMFGKGGKILRDDFSTLSPFGLGLSSTEKMREFF